MVAEKSELCSFVCVADTQTFPVYILTYYSWDKAAGVYSRLRISGTKAQNVLRYIWCQG